MPIDVKELRKRGAALTLSQINKLKSIVFKEVDFPDYVSKRTQTDGDANRQTIAVMCEFHDTNTFDAGRLVKRSGQNGEYWLYFCNNSTCPISGNGLNLIRYHQAVMNKEYQEEITPEMALLDLYVNALEYPVPEYQEMPTKSKEDEAREKDLYLSNLLHLYISKIAQKQLKSSPEGQKYLTDRKIPQYLVDSFGIGYLPSGFKLSEVLLEKKFPKEFLIEKGILSAKTENDTLFDRIVIPMYGEQEDPMSINFEFNKSNVPNLYTRTVHIRNDKDKAYKHRYLCKELPFFNIKACMGKQTVILVEGIVDCLSILDAIIKMKVVENKSDENTFLYKPSETGVVATYGTNGLSEENMKKYLGSFKNILLAADNDDNSAGQTANIKRAKILKELFPKANIKIISWKEKDANDMLVAGRKPEEFWECIENAILPEYFTINHVCSNISKEQTDAVVSAFRTIDAISPLLKEIPTENPLETYKFAEILSKRINIPIEIILLCILNNKKDVLSLISAINQQ